jgi:hypothetical protein
VREAIASRVRVPEILAEEDGGGLQILEDLGSRPLSSLWTSTPASRATRHAEAARVAATIAGTPDPEVNPPFTAEFFFAEMEKSREAFFGDLAHAPLSSDERSVHDAFARGLAAEIAGHPRVFLHRDFHVDNLFDVGDAVGVIDFQDARLGPDSYDLASLRTRRPRTPLSGCSARHLSRPRDSRIGSAAWPSSAGGRPRAPSRRSARREGAASTAAFSLPSSPPSRRISPGRARNASSPRF